MEKDIKVEPVIPPSARSTYIAPVNPDPMALRPRSTTPVKPVDPLAGNRNTESYNRATPPPDYLKPNSSVTRSIAPLPESTASKGEKTESSSSKPKVTERDVSADQRGKEYPKATSTNRAGRVKSPYPPFTELDVAGMPSGSLAKDPATGKIFRLP